MSSRRAGSVCGGCDAKKISEVIIVAKVPCKFSHSFRALFDLVI